MNKTTIALSSAAIAGALLLAPTAAFAGSAPPTTYSPVGTNDTVAIGANGTLNFSGFPGNAGVTATSPSGVSLAVFRAATLGKTTSAGGAVSFVASSPTAGVYPISVVTNSAPTLTATGTLTVLPADSGGLTGTGSELPTLALWGAGAALALGAAGIATVAVRRSRRA